MKLNYMYKNLIEQHTKHRAGLLRYTPFLLSSKRQRQVALLELETGCIEKTPYQITKMTKRKKKKERKKERKKEKRKTED